MMPAGRLGAFGPDCEPNIRGVLALPERLRRRAVSLRENGVGPSGLGFRRPSHAIRTFLRRAAPTSMDLYSYFATPWKDRRATVDRILADMETIAADATKLPEAAE